MFKFFARALCGNAEIAMPHDTLEENLRMILRNGRCVTNLYSSFEHVVWEVKINTPFTGKALESVTKDPKIAVLYAYGMDVDGWLGSRSIGFHTSVPNEEAFVAVLERQDDAPLAKILASNVSGELNEALAKKRAVRDQEVLLSNAESPSKLVGLPKFDVASPENSLHVAAEALIAAGVAA